MTDFLENKISESQAKIIEAIKSGKYNKGHYNRSDGSLGDIYKCNLFVDDTIKENWGVELPRYQEAGDTLHNGWEKRPLRARKMRDFLNGATLYPESGVKSVERQKAAELANAGKLVVATDGVHASVMAPGDRPKIYRSDQADRESTKYSVGVSDSSGYTYFYINPEQYQQYKDSPMRGETVEDIARYGETVTNLRRKDFHTYLDDSISLMGAAMRERRQ